ncbi:MAG TPA: hypothetical protein VFY17_01285 [Pilimelia sp.]|nr:hypothetical protein [Pilimelia sp.]
MRAVRGRGTPLVVLALGLFAAGLLLSGGTGVATPVLAVGVATLVGLGLRPALVRLRRRWRRVPPALAALLVLPAGLLLAAVVAAAALPGWYPDHPGLPAWVDALRGARPPEQRWSSLHLQPGSATALSVDESVGWFAYYPSAASPQPREDGTAAVGAQVAGFAALLWAYALLVDGPRLLRLAAAGGRGRPAARAAVRVCARLVGRQAVLAAAAGVGGYALADAFAVDGAARLGVLVAVAALVPRYGLAVGGAVLALAAFATSREAGLVTAVVAVAVQQVVGRTLAGGEVGRRQALGALGGGVVGLLLAGPAGAAFGAPVGWTAAAAGAPGGTATPRR